MPASLFSIKQEYYTHLNGRVAYSVWDRYGNLLEARYVAPEPYNVVNDLDGFKRSRWIWHRDIATNSPANGKLAPGEDKHLTRKVNADVERLLERF